MTITAIVDAAHAAVGPDGRIWLARPGRLPAAVGREAADLSAAVDRCGDRPRLRLLGTARNARVIAALAAAHAVGRLRLELATPLVAGRSRAVHDDPAAVLAAMSEPGAGGVAASLGGWHPIGAGEAEVYAASAAADAGDGDPAWILRDHPVLRRLRFVTPRCDDGLARVLAGVRDPRWYVDPKYPEKLDRLKAHFALDREHSTRRPFEAAAVRRRMAALSAWRPAELMGPAAEPGRLNAAARAPGGFLLRAFCLSPRPRRGAELATARCFLRLVRDVWLDWLAPPSYDGGEYFVPESFFARALGPAASAGEIAAAYRAHVAAC